MLKERGSYLREAKFEKSKCVEAKINEFKNQNYEGKLPDHLPEVAICLAFADKCIYILVKCI